MAVNADLTHFLQRRELLAYEQRLARSVYAYGVDLRRAAWLHDSRIGDPLMRGVDRRWGATTRALADLLRPTREPASAPILEELARLIRLLRAPLPSVRLLRPNIDEPWPIATPLGTTRGGIHWLVLDIERLMECDPVERTYVLGWALGHLQCDHGPLFAAHMMAQRAGRSLGAVGLVLKPWARVATFSADRAAMLAVGDLTSALEGMPLTHSPDVPWLPVGADLSARRRALEDFANSSVVARLRVFTEAGRPEWGLGMPKPAVSGAVAERLSHVFGAAARLGSNAAWVLGGGVDPRQAKDEADARAARQAQQQARQDSGDDQVDAANDSGKPAPPPPAGSDELDPEIESRLEDALQDTLSVARCDQNLTRRLGLL